jgi:hypothetical protein
MLWGWVRIWTLAAGFSGAALAQYPGHVDTNQASNQPHLRATAVYEYTGDLAKPKANRLIPIVVWDGTQFQPGGLYLAQPAPLAVQSGTQYELQAAGLVKGLFDVKLAENLAGSWIGIGVFQTEKPPQTAKLRASKHLPQVVKEYDPDKPHFAHRPADEGQGGTGSGSGTGNSSDSTAAKAPPVDPDRPTLHKRADSGDSGGSSGSGGGAASPSSSSSSTSAGAGTGNVDPDRPTLHRQANASGGSASGSGSGSGSASSPGGTAPVDPDRPQLRYGRPTTLEAIDPPTALQGVPREMEQIVAVSDARAGEPHVFAYSWPNFDDMTKMKTALEEIAKQALGVPAAPAKSATKTTTKTAAKTAAGAPAAAHRTATKKAAPTVPDLSDEQLHAYELSYGGGATLVFSASLKAQDGTAKYVTLIAKPDFYGNPQVLLKHVTSDKELGFNPRMRLVDAVDADGDHRAELIFELRSKTDRQFVLYRVAGGVAEQVFETASLP